MKNNNFTYPPIGNNNNNNNSGGNKSVSNNNNPNNAQQHGNQHEKNKQNNQHHQSQHNRNQAHHQGQQQQQQPQQHQHQHQHHQPQQFQAQRERSGQRSGQHPDSSTNRDNKDFASHGGHLNLGAVRFTPGMPTIELPSVETKPDPTKKFTGRCRLFVGNIPHNTSEEKLRGLFESFGEVGEVYLGPKSAFGFIKMDTRQNAEAARDALDCTTYEGRSLRVRLAAHAAAVRVKNLSPQVTNELLAYAFRYFGEIERAVVVVDDKGKSTGEGVVEYSKKQSALFAVKRCQQECFLLTAAPTPVLVEIFDQQDEDEGLPEKSVNKNVVEFKEEREVGPRFAEQGTFEHTFGLKWKELYGVEKQKRERLEQEIQEARKNLQDHIEFSRLEHDTMQLRNKLQQLEDNRLKLQQLKELTNSQQRDEHRRQQDLLIRQQEDGILRRQQQQQHLQHYGGPNGLVQPESSFGIQTTTLLDLTGNREQDESIDTSESQQKSQQSGTQAGRETNSAMPISMLAPPATGQARSFADAAMMALSNQQQQQQQQYIPVHQISMHPAAHGTQMNPPSMFATYIQPQHQMQMQSDGQGNTNFANTTDPGQGGFGMSSQQQQPAVSGSSGRQQKFIRQHSNQGNNISVIQPSTSGRARKRGRF